MGAEEWLEWKQPTIQQRGKELDERYDRTDGATVASVLWLQLENDQRQWLYDRVFPLVKRVPESEWTRQQQMTDEIRAKKEVGAFQSVVTAISARQFGYIPDDGRWFALWALNLNLGPESAEQAARIRLPLHWDTFGTEREQKLAILVGSCLPRQKRLSPWIALLAPLLTLSTSAATAKAFGDGCRYQSIHDLHQKAESDVVQYCRTGGGTCYVIELNGNVQFEGGSKHGNIVNIWFDENLAQAYCQRYRGHKISSMPLRELCWFLDPTRGLGINHVTIDRGREERVHIIPIDEIMEHLTQKVLDADSLIAALERC